VGEVEVMPRRAEKEEKLWMSVAGTGVGFERG